MHAIITLVIGSYSTTDILAFLNIFSLSDIFFQKYKIGVEE